MEARDVIKVKMNRCRAMKRGETPWVEQVKKVRTAILEYRTDRDYEETEAQSERVKSTRATWIRLVNLKNSIGSSPVVELAVRTAFDAYDFDNTLHVGFEWRTNT
jgi:hypothetical protein